MAEILRESIKPSNANGLWALDTQLDYGDYKITILGTSLDGEEINQTYNFTISQNISPPGARTPGSGGNTNVNGNGDLPVTFIGTEGILFIGIGFMILSLLLRKLYFSLIFRKKIEDRILYEEDCPVEAA